MNNTNQLLGLNPHGEDIVHLVCPHGKQSHCGVPYRHDDQPIAVYNLEIYKRHTYRIGHHRVLVHNVCLTNREKALLDVMSKFMPESALEAQKKLGQSLVYESASGSQYQFSFLEDEPPRFQRMISEKKVTQHSYAASTIKAPALVSTYSKTELRDMVDSNFLVFSRHMRCPAAEYRYADEFFVNFTETDTPGIYYKNYTINGRLWSIKHDATFSTPGLHSLDSRLEDNRVRTHAGSPITWFEWLS